MKALILLLTMALVLPGQLAAKGKSKVKPYTKISSLKKMDGTLEYAVTKTFKSSDDEDKLEDGENDRLKEEYKEASKAYKEAYAEFKKSKGESEEPDKVSRPKFKIESKKYEDGDDKDKAKQDKDLAKKVKKAEAYNAKLQAAKDADAARKERMKKR